MEDVPVPRGVPHPDWIHLYRVMPSPPAGKEYYEDDREYPEISLSTPTPPLEGTCESRNRCISHSLCLLMTDRKQSSASEFKETRRQPLGGFYETN